MVLVAIGVVYGDIATSPMYVMKSIVAGNGGIDSIIKKEVEHFAQPLFAFIKLLLFAWCFSSIFKRIII